MSELGFVHLHTHSEHSTLDGINRLHKLPEAAKGKGMHALAITDHGTCSSHYKFHKACKAAGIKPILGMEAYYVVGDRKTKEADEDGSSYYHLVLLAMNNAGLKNLHILSSRAYTEGFYKHPRIDDQLLADHSEGIMATSSCLGSRASQLLLDNRPNDAETLIKHHAAIFKDRFFIEVQPHTSEDQALVNAGLLKLAKKNSLPLIVTNDSHYNDPEDRLLHERTLAMQTKGNMYDEKRFSFGDIYVDLAAPDRMAKLCEAASIPLEAMSNTLNLANMVDHRSYFSDRRNRFPTYDRLPEDMTSSEYLMQVAKSGLQDRFNGERPPQEYIERLYEELKTIKYMGFSDYMLILWDCLREIREQNVIVGPGRGSAAGSLVAYALQITQVDPIKYDLLFTRWLNPGRAATPLIFTDEMISTMDNMNATPF